MVNGGKTKSSYTYSESLKGYATPVKFLTKA